MIIVLRLNTSGYNDGNLHMNYNKKYWVEPHELPMFDQFSSPKECQFYMVQPHSSRGFSRPYIKITEF